MLHLWKLSSLVYIIHVALSYSSVLVTEEREVVNDAGADVGGLADNIEFVIILSLVMTGGATVSSIFNLQFYYPKRHKAVQGVPMQGTVM